MDVQRGGFPTLCPPLFVAIQREERLLYSLWLSKQTSCERGGKISPACSSVQEEKQQGAGLREGTRAIGRSHILPQKHLHHGTKPTPPPSAQGSSDHPPSPPGRPPPWGAEKLDLTAKGEENPAHAARSKLKPLLEAAGAAPHRAPPSRPGQS